MFGSMKSRAAVVALVALFALPILAASPASAAGNSANAKACKSNGWTTLVRSDGTPFANQGDCISYGARGGVSCPAGPIPTSIAFITGGNGLGWVVVSTSGGYSNSDPCRPIPTGTLTASCLNFSTSGLSDSGVSNGGGGNWVGADSGFSLSELTACELVYGVSAAYSGDAFYAPSGL